MLDAAAPREGTPPSFPKVEWELWELSATAHSKGGRG